MSNTTFYLIEALVILLTLILMADVGNKIIKRKPLSDKVLTALLIAITSLVGMLVGLNS